MEIPTAIEFRSVHPEFTVEAHPDALVTASIAVALQISAVNKTALFFLIAHLLTLEGERAIAIDGGSGEIESEQVGEKKVTYKTQAMTNREVFFTRTFYGRLFLLIEKRSPSRAFSARVYG